MFKWLFGRREGNGEREIVRGLQNFTNEVMRTFESSPALRIADNPFSWAMGRQGRIYWPFKTPEYVAILKAGRSVPEYELLVEARTQTAGQTEDYVRSVMESECVLLSKPDTPSVILKKCIALAVPVFPKDPTHLWCNGSETILIVVDPRVYIDVLAKRVPALHATVLSWGKKRDGTFVRSMAELYREIDRIVEGTLAEGANLADLNRTFYSSLWKIW